VPAATGALPATGASTGWAPVAAVLALAAALGTRRFTVARRS